MVQPSSELSIILSNLLTSFLDKSYDNCSDISMFGGSDKKASSPLAYKNGDIIYREIVQVRFKQLEVFCKN
jgi:hypothetical protein